MLCNIDFEDQSGRGVGFEGVREVSVGHCWLLAMECGDQSDCGMGFEGVRDVTVEYCCEHTFAVSDL